MTISKARTLSRIVTGTRLANTIIDTVNSAITQANLPAFQGDVTSSVGGNTLTLASSGVTAGSYGNTTAIPVITVDAKGRITTATTNSVSGVTGLTYTNANTSVTVSTSTVDYSANIEPGLNQAYANATSYADTKAATAYSNATSYADTKAATAYSNAVSYTDTVAATKANLAGATFTGGVTVSNTLATGNTVITGFANVSGSLTVGGVATISGNLVVNGTTITVNTSQINTTDSLMYLASNNEVSDSIDIGFAGHYNNGAGANGHTGLIRSAVTKKYYLFQNYQPEFFANNNVDVANTSTGIQMADLVVGNLVANSTLTVTGAATFSNTIAVTGLITGTITSANNTTYLNGQLASYYANSTAPGTAYSNAVAYAAANTYVNTQLALKANLSGAAFTGAVSGITTLAMGNTTVTGTIAVSGAATFSNTVSVSGNLTGSAANVTIVAGAYTTTFANTGATTFPGAVSGITTLAAGNTTITGFANVSQAIYSGVASSSAGALYLFSAGNDTRCDLYNGNTEFKIAATYLSTGGYKPINFYTSDAVSATIAANGNFGIGNTTPADKLSVNGRGMFSGGVGIGTGATVGALDLRTGARTIQLRTAPTGSYYGSALFLSGDVGQTERAWMVATHYNGGGITDLAFEYSSTDMAYSGDASALTYAEKFRMASNGNFGIGNTAPVDKLSVNGTSYFGANTKISIGSSGVSPYAPGLAIDGGSSRVSISLLTANTTDSYIFFGSPTASNRGYVGYDHALDQLVLRSSGSIALTGTAEPATDATYNLGSITRRWNNIYTADAHFSNEGTEGNLVDGTTGNWTLQEGEDNIYMLNNKTGKRYKIKMEEV